MTWEEYAKIVLGNKKVAELKKEYNLCTKKYTYGRYKNFINRLKKKWKYRYDKEKRKNRKVIKYIEDKIQKSFKADYGLELFERTDRLFTETVFELQKIEQILEKGESNE